VQGIRPQCFDRIQFPEIKEIIDRCTRLHKQERYTVKELLMHEFLQPDEPLEIKIKDRDQLVMSTNDEIQMLLKVLDQNKRKAYKQNENEAIQFSFDLAIDKPEDVTKEMVDAQLILDEDAKLVTKLIAERIVKLKKDRELYQMDVSRSHKEESDKHKADEEQKLEHSKPFAKMSVAEDTLKEYYAPKPTPVASIAEPLLVQTSVDTKVDR
jgi:WNK lysine deficient protein kinase